MAAAFEETLPGERDGLARTLVQLDRVTRRFGGIAAVDDLTLELRDGEFFCLLGPSGCGKSTLLRLLAGFEEPDSGRILLDGHDLAGVPPHRRPLNMMFQSYALFPHLRVGRNVGYGLAGLGLSRAAAAARTREVLALVRLDGLEQRFPAQLSGGQRQRVALARALARRPRLLLLDEPLAALDRGLRAGTQAELKDLQHRLGTTFVTVTHDQDEALSMADRIGIMDRGRLVQVGTPRDLYERPRTRFVATFLGDANILDGTIVGQRDGELCLRIVGGHEIGIAAEGGRAASAILHVAIRPENLTLSGPDGSGLPGRVGEVSYRGASSLVGVELRDGPAIRALVPGSGPIRPRRGDAVTVAFDPARAAIVE